MAKPSAVFAWATDAKFAAPYASRDTKTAPAGWPNVDKGFSPGTAIACPIMNYVFAEGIIPWLTWQLDGTSDGDQDAHIVETDATGKAEIYDVEVVNELAVGNTLTVDNQASIGGDLLVSGHIRPVGGGGGIRFRVDDTSIGNADATIDVSADVYIATEFPTMIRTVTLDHTSLAPAEGQVITVMSTLSGGVSKWEFAREDATPLAELSDTNRGGVDFIFANGKWSVLRAWGAATIDAHDAT